MSDPDYTPLYPCTDEGDAFKAGVIQPEVIDRPSKSDLCSSEEDTSSEMQATDTVPLKAEDEERHISNHFYEHVFRITLSNEVCCNKNGPASLIFLNEVNVALRYQTELDQDCLARAVFERLLLEDPAQHIVRRKEFDDDDAIAIEKNVVFYLYQSYYRLKTCTDFKIGPYETAHHVLVSQTASALCNAEMFPDSKLSEYLMKLILHYHDQTGHCERISQFLIEVTTSIAELKSGNLVEILGPSFSFLQEKLVTISLSDRNLFQYIEILSYFTGSDHLIKALLKHSMPKEIKNGKSYQNSLLGLPLAVSCLPKSEFDRYEFFQDPSRSSDKDHALVEERLQVHLITIAKEMHHLFEKILQKSEDSSNLLLQWIGNCLDANSGSAKIWNSQLPEVYASLHGSDGFFINLLAVLLLLCKPFTEPCSPKLLKINPLYCSSEPSTESNKNGVHLRSLVSETCLLPRDEPMETEYATYNFITECFFATHYAFRIGFHVVIEKMVKQNQDLIRTQRLYEEACSRGGETSDIGQQLKEKIEKGRTIFLSYRTALLVPETTHLMLKFHITTATWLSHISTKEEFNIFRTLKFPPLTETSCALSYVPEFILENIIDCTIFLKRFSAKSFQLDESSLEHFLTLILMLMGSPERVKNPHLRAHLSEMLELLMPEEEPSSTSFSGVYREKLFTSHPFVNEIIPTLLNVFVSIEMTDQNMQFEQVFQYRRPMYIALDYLWNFDIHKKRMKEMAENAERNIDSLHPPIFLHFINLLISDAIFLLDEALTLMKKLEEIQQARNSGAWDSMSSEQQQLQEGNFHHMGLLAKFHNVMSNETINTLQRLTTEIKSIFCHPTIVERIAAMLNCFLLNLVGPMKKNFKVKDLKEYEFKPQELVRDICKMYQNLGALKDTYAELFCSAISRDRYYNADLFPQAQVVLKKIGKGILASQLEFIASKVHDEFLKLEKQNKIALDRELHKDKAVLQSSIADIVEAVPGLKYIEEHRREGCQTPVHYFCTLCNSKNLPSTILQHIGGYKHQKKCLNLIDPNHYETIRHNNTKEIIWDLMQRFLLDYEKIHGRELVKVVQMKENLVKVVQMSDEEEAPPTKKRKLNEVPKIRTESNPNLSEGSQPSSMNQSLPTEKKRKSLKNLHFTKIDVSVPKPLSFKRRPILIDGSNLARGYTEPDPIFHCRGIYICVQLFLKMGHSDVKAYIPKWRRNNLTGEIPTLEPQLLDSLYDAKHLKYTCSKEIDNKRISCYDDIFLIKQAVYKKGVVVSNDAYKDLLKKHEKECPGFDEVIKERVLQFMFDGDNLMLPSDPVGKYGITLEKFLSL